MSGSDGADSVTDEKTFIDLVPLGRKDPFAGCGFESNDYFLDEKLKHPSVTINDAVGRKYEKLKHPSVTMNDAVGRKYEIHSNKIILFDVS